jgi:hypothetical protein
MSEPKNEEVVKSLPEFLREQGLSEEAVEKAVEMAFDIADLIGDGFLYRDVGSGFGTRPAFLQKAAKILGRKEIFGYWVGREYPYSC